MSDRYLSADVPQVEVAKMDEDEQCATFQNATLQGSEDQKWAVSIATYVTVPKGLDLEGAKAWVMGVLTAAASGTPHVVFDAMVGRSFDYETITEEEETE